MQRFWEIDFFRGIAICMMVLFHFLWDLNYFGIINVQLYEGFWGLFQKTTASSFLFILGVMIAINHSRGKLKTPEDFLQKAIYVFAAGMALTAATLVLYPSDFIYFGILHLIGVSILFSIPFAGRKIEPLVAGIAVILLPLVYKLSYLQITILIWLGFSPPWRTLDFFPVFPWFGAVLLGIAAGNHFYPKGQRNFKIKEMQNPAIMLVGFLGKHSMKIYFIHQIILFPIAYFVSLL